MDAATGFFVAGPIQNDIFGWDPWNDMEGLGEEARGEKMDSGFRRNDEVGWQGGRGERKMGMGSRLRGNKGGMNGCGDSGLFATAEIALGESYGR